MPDNSADPIVARGTEAALRVWREEPPNADKPEETRPYETLGYIVAGTLELTIGGKTMVLDAGQSYTVPKNAPHRYVVRQTLTAVEAIAPVSKIS